MWKENYNEVGKIIIIIIIVWQGGKKIIRIFSNAPCVKIELFSFFRRRNIRNITLNMIYMIMKNIYIRYL